MSKVVGILEYFKEFFIIAIRKSLNTALKTVQTWWISSILTSFQRYYRIKSQNLSFSLGKLKNISLESRKNLSFSIVIFPFFERWKFSHFWKRKCCLRFWGGRGLSFQRKRLLKLAEISSIWSFLPLIKTLSLYLRNSPKKSTRGRWR